MASMGKGHSVPGGTKMMGKASTTPKASKVIKSGTLKLVRGGSAKMFGKQSVQAAKPR